MTTQNSPVGAIVGLVVVLGSCWYFLGGGLEKQVSNDFEKQYNMTVVSGNDIDRCVHAGIVAASYLQANDSTNYSKWKRIQSEDCTKAGLLNY